MSAWPFPLQIWDAVSQLRIVILGKVTDLLCHRCIGRAELCILCSCLKCEGWVAFCWLALQWNSDLSTWYFSCLVWDQFILWRTRGRACACLVFVCLNINWLKLIFAGTLKMIHLHHLFLVNTAFLYVSFWWWTRGCNFSIKSTESTPERCTKFCKIFYFCSGSVS